MHPRAPIRNTNKTTRIFVCLAVVCLFIVVGFVLVKPKKTPSQPTKENQTATHDETQTVTHDESASQIVVREYTLRDVDDDAWSPQPRRTGHSLKINIDQYQDLVGLMRVDLDDFIEENFICAVDYNIEECFCVARQTPTHVFHQIWIEGMGDDIFNSTTTSRYCQGSGEFHLPYPSWIVVDYYLVDGGDRVESFNRIIDDPSTVKIFTDMSERCYGANICRRQYRQQPATTLFSSLPSTSSDTEGQQLSLLENDDDNTVASHSKRYFSFYKDSHK